MRFLRGEGGLGGGGVCVWFGDWEWAIVGFDTLVFEGDFGLFVAKRCLGKFKLKIGY